MPDGPQRPRGPPRGGTRAGDPRAGTGAAGGGWGAAARLGASPATARGCPAHPRPARGTEGPPRAQWADRGCSLSRKRGDMEAAGVGGLGTEPPPASTGFCTSCTSGWSAGRRPGRLLQGTTGVVVSHQGHRGLYGLRPVTGPTPLPAGGLAPTRRQAPGSSRRSPAQGDRPLCPRPGTGWGEGWTGGLKRSAQREMSGIRRKAQHLAPTALPQAGPGRRPQRYLAEAAPAEPLQQLVGPLGLVPGHHAGRPHRQRLARDQHQHVDGLLQEADLCVFVLEVSHLKCK